MNQQREPLTNITKDNRPISLENLFRRKFRRLLVLEKLRSMAITPDFLIRDQLVLIAKAEENIQDIIKGIQAEMVKERAELNDLHEDDGEQ